MASIAVLAVGANAAKPPRSHHSPSHSETGSAGGDWHIVHLFLQAGIYDGYGCDDFGSSNDNCMGNLGGATTTSPWDGGTGTARWLRGPGGRVYVGLFKGTEYLSGWLPSAGSDRFIVTSGHMGWGGDDNVVSGDDPDKKPSTALPPGDPAAQGAPLYIDVRNVKNWLGVHTGYTFDVRGWVRTAPASSARAQFTGPQQHRSAGANFVGAVGDFGPNTIASLFWELAKEPTKNFVLDQLGIPTTASKLDALKKRLDAIDEHLTRIGDQLNAAIAGLNYDEAIRDANNHINGLESTYDQHIVLLLNDTIKVKKAEEAGDEAALKAAREKYDHDKKEFVDLKGASTFAAELAGLHRVFQPGHGATGLVAGLGQKLLGAKRYLTRRDSERQDALYHYYEEYQALAAWLTCEWDIARGDADLVPGVAKKFQDFVAEQRNPNVENGLPPDLPAGVVLDRGKTSLGATSLYKAMFTTPDRDGAFYQETSIREPNWVPHIVQSANADKLRGFSDWTLPSQTQLFELMGLDVDEPVRTGITERLREAGCPPPQRENDCVWKIYDYPDWIWTRDAVTVTLLRRRYGDITFNYTVHEAVTLRNGAPDEHPRVRGTGPYEFGPTEVDFEARDGAKAQVLLVRSSGDTRYF